MENNDLALVKADKSKAKVIIDKNKLKEKVNNFIKENHINVLNKDPTEVYQKQIHQAIQKCNTLINTHRYLLNIKPMAPKLNVYLKTHKDNHLYDQ
jgi:Na+/phosphate symporter